MGCTASGWHEVFHATPLPVSFCHCRTVGVRLGAGESLHDIMSSSRQVAEGVSTAGQSVWRCLMQVDLSMDVWSVTAASGRLYHVSLFQPEAAWTSCHLVAEM